jgi:dihydrofolate synthase / folylpolyglutamate synthase
MKRPASFATLAQWLGWLETLSPTEIDLGLERVTAVLQRLPAGRPKRVIHVAGTNGKGSSAAMLEALYLQRSDSVGCYTSPHIHRFNERIRVAGKAVGDRQIVQAFEQVEAVREGVALTYFEYGTLAALCVFEAAATDTVILEIGLGGRLDAVNAIEADGGIITNVSVDHVAWLGNDIDSIAMEKAGILRAEKPFVFASENVPQVVLDAAREAAAELLLLGRDYRYQSDDDGNWAFAGRQTVLPGLHRPALPGAIQLQNAAGVLALLEALGEDDLLRAGTINRAFSGLQLPGRLQRVDRQRPWLLDVAHNRGAADVLAQSLAAEPALRKLTCIAGMLDDKSIADIIEPLLPFVHSWIAVTAASPRAIPAAELAGAIANLSGKPCLIAASMVAACQHSAAATDCHHPVLVTGSFFTVGPALRWLAEHPG